LLFSLLSVPPFFFSFFFYCSGLHRDLLSFPTRRSSDLSSLVFLWFLFRFLFRFFLLRLFCFLLRLYLISVFLFTLLELLVIPVEIKIIETIKIFIPIPIYRIIDFIWLTL